MYRCYFMSILNVVEGIGPKSSKLVIVCFNFTFGPAKRPQNPFKLEMKHFNFNLRAREYEVNNDKLVRKKISLKARILELIENVFPIYKDHHMIVAKKVVNFDDLDNIRMLTTNSTDEWISYRYKKFEIFDRTK